MRISPLRHGAPLAAAAALACALTAAPARAQMMHVPESDWRRGDRHDALAAAAKPPIFYFELRFGEYFPAIDSDPALGGKTPYASVFGSQCPAGSPATCTPGSTSPLFHFGLELDAVPIRIPYVGAFGVGFGWGVSTVSATANFSQDPVTGAIPGGPSGQSTTLTIMPMHTSLVLRADELMRRTGIPFVPYGKVGVAFDYWRASSDLGTEVYDPCELKTNVAVAPTACSGKTGRPATISGSRLTPGLHFALGGMVALNWIEPQASARLDQTTGVHHAYVFGEYYNDRITLASNVMRVGTSSWVAGLAIDF